MSQLEEVLGDSRVHLILVDDGSTDQTRHLLETLSISSPRCELIAIAQNSGKAEAVRRGLLSGLERHMDAVGYFDADMSTPPSELSRLVGALDSSEHTAIIGARIAYLGADIKRHRRRHYLGRVFATGASLVLGERIYDTQCGAKVFRTNEILKRSLEAPFASRWAFDVELLGRILALGGTVNEVPLARWHDVPGSKVKLGSALRSGLELVKIHWRLRRFRDDS